jgi:hypothetical protein
LNYRERLGERQSVRKWVFDKMKLSVSLRTAQVQGSCAAKPRLCWEGRY